MTATALDTNTKQVVMDEGKGAYRVPWEDHEHSMRSQCVQPTFKELVAYLVKYGKDGLLESALHLSDADFARLSELCAGTPARKGKR